MSPRVRLVLVLVFALVPLASWVMRGWSGSGPLAFDARAAPSVLAHYAAVEDAPLEPDVLEMLQPDSYVMRLYQTESGGTAWVYLAAYSASDSTGAHDPSVCYPANGWDLQGLRNLDVRLGNGESLTARLLLATQAGQEELVLYWFQPMDRWPRSGAWEQLLRAYDGFLGRPQYVFVRLSTESSDMAQAELVAIAREIAPWLRGAMTPRVLATVPDAGRDG